MSGISSEVFDMLAADIIRRLQPKTFLDIGPGQGKYGKLVGQHAPECQRCTIEVSPIYVDQYQLGTLYDNVYVGDAAEIVMDRGFRNKVFDLVIIGDCIEHLPKSRGLDLLNFLTYRCGYLILIAPEFSYYDTSNMEHTESHISVWSEYDLTWHDRFAFMRSEIMQFFLLRGYQPAPISLDEVVAGSNADPSPIRSFAGKDYKLSSLELRTRERTEVIDGTAWSYRHA